MAKAKVFTMRLDGALIDRIDEVSAKYSAAATGGTGPELSRAEVIRWLLTLGVEQMEKHYGILGNVEPLDVEGRGGARRRVRRPAGRS
jgi:hypothetical protein